MASYTVYRVSDQRIVAYCPTLKSAVAQAAWAQRNLDGTHEILEVNPGSRRVLDADGQFLRNLDEDAE